MIEPGNSTFIHLRSSKASASALYSDGIQSGGNSSRCIMGCLCHAGVWGSAFSILFNRLLGGQAHRRGSTLEEELEHIKPVHIVGEDHDDEDGRGNESHPQGGDSWPPHMFTSLISNSAILKSREGRASKVHNFMRGLRLSALVPHSPCGDLAKEALAAQEADAVKEPNEFNRIYEPLDPKSKKIHVVDSGLSFNLPYPLVLRPERGVDLIISFDFTARPSDSSPPFKELLLAEKWAHLNKLPFPKIDPKVFDREGLKECYVFKPEDGQRNCPTIIHFVLANINFRNFKSPGVPRESKEEQESADFDIFDDPENTYSTFNFHYSTEAFARLHDLMEFNTLNNFQVIKDAIKDCALDRRGNPPCVPISLGNRNKIKKKAVSEK